MDPVDDGLYRVYQCLACRRGLSPRDYFEFRKRLINHSDTDLSQMYLPETEVRYKPVVAVGPVYATRSAIAHVAWYEILDAVAVHEAGDWGEISPQQWLANNRAVASGGRVCSAHRNLDGRKFWVISEGNPRRATIVMPADTSFLRAVS
jgi:hypothetical protein